MLRWKLLLGWWWNRAKTEMGMNPPWLLSCWLGWRTVEEKFLTQNISGGELQLLACTHTTQTLNISNPTRYRTAPDRTFQQSVHWHLLSTRGDRLGDFAADKAAST